MAVECWRLTLSGQVQGVFFRSSTQDQAKSLGLTGWVRNLRDGRVEVLAEGDVEQLQALYDWCKEGPADAKVDDVQREVEPLSGQYSDFDVAPDA